jgi:hypothetical protein
MIFRIETEYTKLAYLLMIFSNITAIMMIFLCILFYFICKKISKIIKNTTYFGIITITVVIWLIEFYFYNIINEMIPNFPIRHPYIYCALLMIIRIIKASFFLL